MDWSLVGKSLALFVATAIAELIGCYLPLLWLTGKGSVWLLIPASISLMIFVWLLTLHPIASGRVYATYGAVYIVTAIVWLYFVDGIKPMWTDTLGAIIALLGAGIIISGQRA